MTPGHGGTRDTAIVDGWRGVRTIVTGGQTGADRAALDVALALGLECGGWIPEGRMTEDGVIAPRYVGLIEADSEDPAVRTRLNVRDSDGTLIVSHGSLSGGSAWTRECAVELGRPWLHVDLHEMAAGAAAGFVRDWLDANRPSVLNVAGPRASEDPVIYAGVEALLDAVLSGSD